MERARIFWAAIEMIAKKLPARHHDNCRYCRTVRTENNLKMKLGHPDATALL